MMNGSGVLWQAITSAIRAVQPDGGARPSPPRQTVPAGAGMNLTPDGL